MKREALVLMIGSLLLGTGDAEAQRNDRNRDRNRDRDGRVERLEPVHAPGRVVAQPVYRPARHHRGSRSRVVYSSRRHRPSYVAHGSWVTTDWGRVVRFRPIVRPRHRAFLNRGELNELLGRHTVRHIRDAGRSVGLRGEIRGHWVTRRYDTILVVSMGGSDVAELIDFNGDGFVDEAYVISPRGYRAAAIGW